MELGSAGENEVKPGQDLSVASPGKAAHDAGSMPTLPVAALNQETSARSAIRILLADDHRILREGLASLLSEEPDLEVVAQAADGLEAIELARSTRPDVILMDVTMPRLDGIEATRRITAELASVAVIGLSMHEEDDMAEAMHEAGAVVYLSKGGPADVLVATIRNCVA